MSIDALKWAWSLDIPPTQKLVLGAYADHAAPDGSRVFPSIATIVKKTGLSRRWVQIITHALQAAGHMIDAGRGPRGQRQWRLNMPARDGSAPVSEGAHTSQVESLPSKGEATAARSTRALTSPANSAPSSGKESPAPSPGVLTSPANSAASRGEESAAKSPRARTSPANSARSRGEAHLTPGANPSSPEPSLTIN